MNITITTDGGFTGRGIGEVSVDTEADERLREAAANAQPVAWRDEYASGRGADLVRYTLTLGGRSTSWTTGAVLPTDLQELFEATWAHK